jgi:5'-deoxynucleotidase YfbR-like HD superfamily hydrolase
MRYFLINFFQIATPENDVDAYRSKQKEAEASEDKAVAEEIIKRLDEEVREYIADNQDEAPKVKKLVSKYVKNGEYFRIKEPKLAAKLYEEFESTFTTSGENKEGN